MSFMFRHIMKVLSGTVIKRIKQMVSGVFGAVWVRPKTHRIYEKKTTAAGVINVNPRSGNLLNNTNAPGNINIPSACMTRYQLRASSIA